MRTVKDGLLIGALVLGGVLLFAGCSKPEGPASKPKTEKTEHPKGEHPKSEHPKGEHPKGEHPK